MIKATINNNTKRAAFAKAGGKKLAGGSCTTNLVSHGLVLNNYKVIATGNCSDKQKGFDLSNIIAFNKQKEVA